MKLVQAVELDAYMTLVADVELIPERDNLLCNMSIARSLKRIADSLDKRDPLPPSLDSVALLIEERVGIRGIDIGKHVLQHLLHHGYKVVPK